MANVTKLPQQFGPYLSLVKAKGDGELQVLATFNNDNLNMAEGRFRDAVERFLKDIDGDVMILERQDAPDSVMEEEY